jgi:hypothetical protein
LTEENTEISEAAEERRGRPLTMTDKFMNAFWNFQGAYFTIVGWLLHVIFFVGGLIWLAVVIHRLTVPQ